MTIEPQSGVHHAPREQQTYRRQQQAVHIHRGEQVHRGALFLTRQLECVQLREESLFAAQSKPQRLQPVDGESFGREVGSGDGQVSRVSGDGIRQNAHY
jgi:hypothetical protein